MEPIFSPDELQEAVDSAAHEDPLPVVLAWLQAGARPSCRGLKQAAAEGRSNVFVALLGASNQKVLPALRTCRAMMDSDEMMDAWLARLTPADLNRGPFSNEAPAWFRAFECTPCHDENGRFDPARAARLHRVLAKMQNAGAYLQALEHDPDIGLDAPATQSPHHDALRALLRVPHERAALGAVADEAMADGFADQPVTASRGRRRL